MDRHQRTPSILLCILFILSYPIMISNDSFSGSLTPEGWKEEALQSITAIDLPINYTDDWDQACSSVIVTGNATKDGRAILMKNRDLPEDPVNIPVYVPATFNSYAFVGVNTNTMGINEKGLAVMNTYLPALAGSEPIEGNLRLNQMILEKYESVSEVAYDLNNSYSLIGPVYRANLGSVATCIGVIDRFGAGAFFEVSDTKAYVQYVIDGYDSRANHPRIFPGAASEPSGRDQYLLDVLDEVYNENSYISPEHVMQNVSRYVHHKELGSVNFSIDGEACNPRTVASMVAVSGDERYGGVLNCMWTACGSNPIVGVYVPSMACAEFIPESIQNLWTHTSAKYRSARAESNPPEGLLYPERVREVQQYAFFAESFTVDAYEQLMSSVLEGLSEQEIRNTIHMFIEEMDDYASEIFIEERTDIEAPLPITFPTPVTITPSLPTSPTSTTSTTYTTPSPTSSTSESLFDDTMLLLTVGLVSGFSLMMIIALIQRRYT